MIGNYAAEVNPTPARPAAGIFPGHLVGTSIIDALALRLRTQLPRCTADAAAALAPGEKATDNMVHS